MIGVVEFNLLALLAGLGLLWGLRGFSTLRDAGEHVGIAYMLGLAAVTVVATLVLIAGGSLSTWVVLAIFVAVAGAGAATGVGRGRSLPREGGKWALPRTVGDLITLLLAAVCFALLVAFLRAFRHQPLAAYDAWNFWIPKAKAIFYFGGLDEHFFRNLPAPSYPLFVPTLDAMVFRLAHSADPTLLAAQSWFLLLGVVAAVAGLLRGIARRGYVWLFLALFLVLPEVEHRWFQLLADWTVDTYFALAALMLVRWLLTRESWLLFAVPVPVAAMLTTKREGQLYAAALLVATIVATRERKNAGKLVAVFAGTYLVAMVPWRLWWMSRHLTSDIAEGGTGHAGSFGRLLGSIRSVAAIVFDPSLWQLTMPVALVVAVAAVAMRRARTAASFYLVLGGLTFAGLCWTMWATPGIPTDAKDPASRIPRAASSLALLSLVLTPVFASAVLAPNRALALRPLAGGRAIARIAYDRLTALREWQVLAAFVILQWALVLGIAFKVRHAGWIFYQGGDQLWYYTTAWLLAHGQFPQPGVGYLWSVLLAPLARITGPDLLQAFPGVIVIQFVFLLPLALFALYGIARRIAGRLFGYWALLVWLVVPLIGIRYTDAGYHQRFTEALLPQGFGLTAMADFPTTVAALVCMYFCAKVVVGEDARFAAAAAGIAGGAAVAIKPASALVLAGPALAFAATRNWGALRNSALGLVPAVAALAFVKWRGFGYVPVLHSASGARVASGSALDAPVVGGARNYVHLDWHQFLTQLDQLREHFWSGRLLEWLVVAGLLAIFIRSRRFGFLMAGWFVPIIVIKTASGRADMEGGGLLRVLMPAYPAFVLMIAALPFLLPTLARRIPPPTEKATAIGARMRWTLAIAAVLVTAVVPIAAYAVDSPLKGPHPTAVVVQQPPVPFRRNLGLRAVRKADAIVLTWRRQHAAGGPLFYHVFRASTATGFYTCHTDTPANWCGLRHAVTDLGATRDVRLVDHPPRPRHWIYYVGVAGNWLNDLSQGDVYMLSGGAAPPPLP